MADPRVTPDDTVAHWTTQGIIDTDDELKTRLATRASAPAPVLDTDAVQQVAPQLNAAQAEAAAALASGTRLSVIEGYAGAGKTALLQAAVQLRDQRPLLTVTPTLKAPKKPAAPDQTRVPCTNCSTLMATDGTKTTSGTN